MPTLSTLRDDRARERRRLALIRFACDAAIIAILMLGAVFFAMFLGFLVERTAAIMVNLTGGGPKW